MLSLTVTPQITPDDRVILDLLVTKDSVGDVITTERGGAVPSIDTRSVQTQVLVDNGQTVVLGGIYETEQNENMTKVPYLGDIPWVGVTVPVDPDPDGQDRTAGVRNAKNPQRRIKHLLRNRG